MFAHIFSCHILALRYMSWLPLTECSHVDLHTEQMVMEVGAGSFLFACHLLDPGYALTAVFADGIGCLAIVFIINH